MSRLAAQAGQTRSTSAAQTRKALETVVYAAVVNASEVGANGCMSTHTRSEGEQESRGISRISRGHFAIGQCEFVGAMCYVFADVLRMMGMVNSY